MSKEGVEKMEEQMKGLLNGKDILYLQGLITGLIIAKTYSHSEKDLQELEELIEYGKKLENQYFEKMMDDLKQREWLEDMNRKEKLRSQDIARRPFINYITGEPEYKW